MPILAFFCFSFFLFLIVEQIKLHFSSSLISGRARSKSISLYARFLRHENDLNLSSNSPLTNSGYLSSRYKQIYFLSIHGSKHLYIIASAPR